MFQKKTNPQKKRKILSHFAYGRKIPFVFLFLMVLSIPLTVVLNGTSQVQFLKANSNTLTSSGTHLMLNGKITQFTGVNAFEIPTNLNVNPGCGPGLAAPDSFFSTLRPNSLVRVWGFEGSMTKYNQQTKQFDWSALDAVFASAAKYNQLIILSLGNQWGTCDDNRYKDVSYYAGGYKKIYNPRGNTPVAYWDYIQAVISHFKSNSALGMWELMNEPEAQLCVNGNDANGSCSGNFTCNESQGMQSLKSFFDTAGSKVKQLDPNHLIESGFLGSGQCGASGGDYQGIHQSSGIDVASYHDYGNDTSPMPGDQYNGLKVRLNQMKNLNKPLIIGEVGIKAQNNTGSCNSLQQRVSMMNNKMNAQFPAGVAAFIPWDWMPANSGGCVYETITKNDPLMTLLHKYPLLGNLPLTNSSQDLVTPTPELVPSLPVNPVVSIIEPSNQTVLTPGQTINIVALAADTSSISQVVFTVNSVPVCVSTHSPYGCTWTTPSVQHGVYTFSAKAYAGNGNYSVQSVSVSTP